MSAAAIGGLEPAPEGYGRPAECAERVAERLKVSDQRARLMVARAFRDPRVEVIKLVGGELVLLSAAEREAAIDIGTGEIPALGVRSYMRINSDGSMDAIYPRDRVFLLLDDLARFVEPNARQEPPRPAVESRTEGAPARPIGRPTSPAYDWVLSQAYRYVHQCGLPEKKSILDKMLHDQLCRTLPDPPAYRTIERWTEKLWEALNDMLRPCEIKPEGDLRHG